MPSRSNAPRPRAPRLPRGEFAPAYVTRKRLTPRELLTAAAIGAGIGLACAYVAAVWLERTPVLPPAPDAPERPLDGTVTPQRAAP